MIRRRDEGDGSLERPYNAVRKEFPLMNTAWMNAEVHFPGITESEAREMPLNISASIAGHRVARVHVDGGSGVEVMYEHCFLRLQRDVQERLEEDICPLMGFFGEVVEPLGSLNLPFTLRYGERTRTVCLRFSIVRAPSKYNVILGRPGMKALRAVPSTVHGYIKFPTPKGIATVRSSTEIIASVTKKTQGKKGVEKWVLNGEHPEQTIRIGSQLSDKGKAGLKEVLLHNADVFAWTHKDMTGVPRTLAQHTLDEFHWMEPIKQKRRNLGLQKSQAVRVETAKLVQAGIVRPVKYPCWIANPVMIAKSDNSWRMCIDFKDLNKACPKDSYPLPEIEKKIESLAQYPLRCFLDAYKGYHQIQMNPQD
ncbi:uncharacterized protein LOC143559728 [Bidens hawaiensis]|uniref:uncharacterized protein LOC143559728 n=1 Tax=Bidens hawaiensis TaxID=980011 RepID=UPI0040499C04